MKVIQIELNKMKLVVPEKPLGTGKVLEQISVMTTVDWHWKGWEWSPQDYLEGITVCVIHVNDKILEPKVTIKVEDPGCFLEGSTEFPSVLPPLCAFLKGGFSFFFSCKALVG